MDISQAAALAEGVTLIGLLIYCWQSERRERLDAQKRLLDKCDDHPADPAAD